MRYRLLLIILLLIGQPVQAGLIRDAEIEAYLRDLSAPVFQAASMSPQQVRLFIVNDDRINAFVAGGSNMFLHTGLMMATDTPEMLLSVIAHETGHIAGGHLLQTEAALEQAQVGAILTYLLGAATIAAGGSDVGAAILSGGSHAANRNLLSYSRANEQAADQAALSYFDRMGISAEGMLHMFERLRQEEKRHLDADADVYARTHPLSQDRITHIRNHHKASSYQGALPPDTQLQHQRMRGKLTGFLKELPEVLRTYPKDNHTMEARIARAVAYGQVSQVEEALAELQPLLVKNKYDAYLHELYGYLLFKGGRVQEAADAYRAAQTLAPDAALIRSDYGKVLVALGDEESLELAQETLELSSRLDQTYHQTWRLLARVYGVAGQTGMAELALAELAALNNDREELELRLKRADPYLEPYSAAGLRAEDLRLFAKTLDEDE